MWALKQTYDPVGNRKQKVSTISGYPGGLSNYNANDQLATDTYDAIPSHPQATVTRTILKITWCSKPG
jgi:hypothetical protein